MRAFWPILRIRYPVKHTDFILKSLTILPFLLIWNLPKGWAQDTYGSHLFSSGIAESAPSLGSLGLRLSSGLTRLPSPKQDLFQTGQQGVITSDHPLARRLWIAKGLSIPVNVGLNLSQLQEMGWLDVTSYIQWTFYEGFAKPALAIRGIYGKSFGMETMQMSSAGGDFVVSHGFIKYFAIFGALGLRRLQTDHYNKRSLGYELESKFEIKSDSKLLSVAEIGLQAAFVPGFAALTVASSLSDHQTAYHTAKVTLSL